MVSFNPSHSRPPASADWESLGSAFYRRQETYQMLSDWTNRVGNDLAAWKVVGEPGGGLVAVTRDHQKPTIFTKTSLPSSKRQIWIFTLAGNLVATLQWDSPTPIIHISFISPSSPSSTAATSTSPNASPSSSISSTGTTLLLLTLDGTYRLYPISLSTPPLITNPTSNSNPNSQQPPPAPILLTNYSQYSLGTDAADSGVLDVKSWEDGMVCLLAGSSGGGPRSQQHGGGYDTSGDNSGGGGEGGGWFLEVKGLGGGGGGGGEDAEGGGGPGSGEGGRVMPLAATNLSEPPLCWAVIPPDQSPTRATEVLVATRDTVLKVDDMEVVNQHLTRGPFTSLTPSPNGRFIALTTSAVSPQPNILWVVSSDFTRSLSEFDLAAEARNVGIDIDSNNNINNNRGSGIAGRFDMEDLVSGGGMGARGEGGAMPNQVVWCGSNSVAVAWDTVVVMVGPFGETLRYFYADPVHLLGEIDGTRIMSSDRCEFLQKVPQSTVDIFLPGSTHPAAILYEASEQFSRKSPKSDESIRSIRFDLTNAVDTCIDAAGREFDVYWQKSLLKAASFGKTFLDMYNPADFVTMSQTLRVLNAARYYEIGLPITYEEYQSQSPTRLVSRLTSLSHHLLAMRISSFLGLSPAPVLKHWAEAKIAAAKGRGEDERVCRTIVEKLKGQNEVGCADVAKTAWTTGQTGLATRLLDFETRASKQVPLLLSMKEDDLALIKAIQSGDPDLVYMVLLNLKRSHSLGSFFRFIDNKPEAAALLQAYAKQNDLELLRDFYYQDDRKTESGCLMLEESMTQNTLADKIAKIKGAAKFFSEDKERSFESKMVDDHLKLLNQQLTFEKESDNRRNFVGLTVNDTIRALLIYGYPKKADKVKSDFKVPDKRFWYIKVKALTQIRDWEALEQFARSKRSPIGYEPWVEHLVATANNRQAASFVPRCEPRNRVELYVKCGEWLKAGQECQNREDRRTLMDLRQRAPNSIIAAQLERIIDEMRPGEIY